MKTFLSSLKNILIIIGVLLLLFLVFKFTKDHYKGELEEEQREQRTLKIKNDTLTKVADGYYQKLVADTNEIKDLKKVVKDLKLELENPQIVERIKIVPKTDTIFLPAEESTFTDTAYHLVDYYPKKENYFIKYESDIDFITKKDLGRFSFNPIDINIGVEKKDGLYQATIQVPEYFDVEQFDIQSTPLEPEKKDNFDWLLGAGYFNNINTGEQGLDISGGIKVHDFYLLGSGRTDSSIGLKLLIGL